MTTTPQTEAQRLAALISATLDSQDDSYLTCSVTKCLLQQAATELLRPDALRLELQTQLADYKDACTKAETRAVPASTGMHWTENEPVRLPQARTGRVYLAGPMTGLPELNFPAFTQEAERLRDEGLQVLNPADHGIVDGADWADYLRHDIAGLASCERIHILRGWTKSKGACLEMTIAKALGMAVTYQVDAEMEHSNVPAGPQEEGRPGIPLRKAYKHLLIVAPAQELGLTDEEIEAIAKKHMSTVGDHWCNEDAIREIHAEDFARAIIAALLAKWGQVMDDAQAPAPAQEIDKSVADAEIKAMYVESQGSEKGWLGIEGSYFIGGVVAARKQKAAPAPAQEPSRPQNCGTSYCSCIECVCEPAQEVGLTDETQAQDERRSTHLAASGGAHVG